MTLPTKKDDNLENKNSTLANRPKVGILQKIAAQKRAFLVDTSGSMDEIVTDGPKIDIVNGLLRSLKDELSLTRLFEFNSDVHEVNTSKEFVNFYPTGGTALHLAFQEMKEKGIKDIVLLTDGFPDLPSAALAESRGLKIDIVYIGPSPTPQFLKDLAAANGGRFQDQNMLKSGSSLLLKEKIKGLLTSGK